MKKEKWKRRALDAERTARNLYHRVRVLEARLKDSETRSLHDSFALDNYREEAQRRRDREIGEMGGGG